MYVDKIVAIRFELPNLFSLGHHPSTSLKYPILQTTCLLPAVFDATLLCCSDYAQIDRKLNTENSNRGKDTRVGGAKEGRSCPPDHWRAGGLELTGYFATSFLPPASRVLFPTRPSLPTESDKFLGPLRHRCNFSRPILADRFCASKITPRTIIITHMFERARRRTLLRARP